VCSNRRACSSLPSRGEHRPALFEKTAIFRYAHLRWAAHVLRVPQPWRKVRVTGPPYSMTAAPYAQRGPCAKMAAAQLDQKNCREDAQVRRHPWHFLRTLHGNTFVARRVSRPASPYESRTGRCGGFAVHGSLLADLLSLERATPGTAEQFPDWGRLGPLDRLTNWWGGSALSCAI